MNNKKKMTGTDIWTGENVKMTLGEKLIEYRYKHKPKLTQMKMVRLLGCCSYESYRKWELGITEPSEKNAERIKAFLRENSKQNNY